MNKLFLFATSLAVTVFTLGAPALHARPEFRNHSENQHAWNPTKLKSELGLSDEQVAKIKTEFRAQKAPLKEQSQKVKAARTNLRHAIQSGAPEAELRSSAAALGAAEGDLAVVRSALFARIAPILTPEQLAKIRDLQATR